MNSWRLYLYLVVRVALKPETPAWLSSCKLVALKRETIQDDDKNEYEMFLSTVYGVSQNIPKLKKSLDAILKWCGYRNEVVHAMFHKDLDALRACYKEHVEEGFRLAREIDSAVTALKRT